MKSSPYPEYRESGVEWLGSVPHKWDVIRIGHLSPVKRGASPRPIDDPKYFDDNGEYHWTRISDVTASDMYLLNAPQRLSQLGSSLSVKLEPGELFLSIAATVGKPCITGVKACIHDGFVYFPELRVPPKFLFYVFAAEQAYAGLGKMGTQLNLNTDTVAGIRVAVGSPSEMNQIVAFLDHETAKIDRLIEKQQQLIALLKEKRQAVISHAVTKGLNPDAPMKDSGVEWLGEVPAHWEVSRLGYLVSVGNGSTPNRSTEEYWGETSEDGIGWLSSTMINDGEIFDAEQFVTTRAVRECHLPICQPGTVLVAITGEGQTRGRAALLQTRATINQHLAFLSPDARRVTSRFLWRQLEARYDWLRYESSGGGSTRAALTCEFLGRVPTVVPPIAEQEKIVEWIDRTAHRLDLATQKAEASLILLQERRTALISAAVTGKIDVRNWQPSEVEQPEPEPA